MSTESAPEAVSPNEEKLTRLINIYMKKNSELQLDFEIVKDDLVLTQAYVNELEAKVRELSVEEVESTDDGAVVGAVV